jgi:hypothetical protein
VREPEPLQWPNIEELIDNKMYRNRYRKLIREGHLVSLLWLAAMADKKEQPSHWFAWSCSVKRWEFTLVYVKEYMTEGERNSIVASIEEVQPGSTFNPSPQTPQP